MKVEWDPTNPEELDLLQNLLDAAKGGFGVLQEIRNKVFRPARKHGYDDPKVQKLLKEIPGNLGEELIWELEQLYNDVLNEHDLGGRG